MHLRQLYVRWPIRSVIPVGNCFPNQIRSMTKQISFVEILPDDCQDTFLCCNRCAVKILKRTTPSTAYWNNLTVPSIPTKLQILSEVELRLISRVTPFMKVVRLGGTFGQKGFKGQAVLFAQQVEEVAE